MPFTAQKSGSKKPLPHDRPLVVELLKVDPTQSKFADKEGNHYPSLQWTYKVIGPEQWAGRQVAKRTNAELIVPRPNAKKTSLWEHLSQSTGHLIVEGETVDEQTMIGKLFLAWMDMPMLDGQGNLAAFQGIKSVNPYDASVQGQAPPAAPSAQPAAPPAPQQQTQQQTQPAAPDPSAPISQERVNFLRKATAERGKTVFEVVEKAGELAERGLSLETITNAEFDKVWAWLRAFPKVGATAGAIGR